MSIYSLFTHLMTIAWHPSTTKPCYATRQSIKVRLLMAIQQKTLTIKFPTNCIMELRLQVLKCSMLLKYNILTITTMQDREQSYFSHYHIWKPYCFRLSPPPWYLLFPCGNDALKLMSILYKFINIPSYSFLQLVVLMICVCD